MKVNDVRNKKTEFKFDDLEYAQVYVSHRMQKYVMFTQENLMVCLETGESFDRFECDGDAFTLVNAELVVK